MLDIRSKTLTARILPFGATLVGLWHKDVPYSLVIGSPDAAAYTGDLTYCGAVIGPVANRLSDAVLSIDDAVYALEANEGRTSLHGGAAGTHAQDWTVVQHDARSITMELILTDGTGGLPGSRHLHARYEVEDGGTLRLTLTAQSDKNTVINLAHHPYWSLDSLDTIAAHRLRVKAGQYLPVDEQLLPTGEVAPVESTRFDFNRLRKVPTDQSLDVNYCVSDRSSKAPRPVATLVGSSGVTLDVETTEPGLQVYNGSSLPWSRCQLLDDRRLQPFAGIALEPQRWPDAGRHRHFPSIGLAAGETYQQTTLYRIGMQLS